jgi:hypothetical protein
MIYNIVGFLGASCLLFGFYRISIGKWKNKSFWYELDNLMGAAFLIIYQLHLRAYISVVLNVIWTLVAFRGIVSFAERYREQHRHPQP